MREGRRLLSGPLIRLPRERSPKVPKLKRKSTLLSREAAMARRGTRSRSTRSSRRRASRARWSSSTRGTLSVSSFALGMAPSIARTLPTIAGGAATHIAAGGATTCELAHTSAIYFGDASEARAILRRLVESAKGEPLQRLAPEKAREVAGDAHRVAHQETLDRRQAVDGGEAQIAQNAQRGDGIREQTVEAVGHGGEQ